MLDAIAFVVVAATSPGSADSVGPPPSAASPMAAPQPAPSAEALEELRSRFHFHGEARLAHRGIRLVVSRPRFAADGLGFEAVIGKGDSALAPEAVALPRPVPWSEIDSLWLRRSQAGVGALIGALALGAGSAAAGYHGHLGDQADAWRFAVFSGGLGVLGGAFLGATVGSGWHTWELVWPARSARGRSRPPPR